MQGLGIIWLGDDGIGLLSLATLLIALGKAGEEPALSDFFDHQLSEKTKRKYSEENNHIGTSCNLWSTTASFTGACIATFWFGSIGWFEKFRISSLLMGSAYLLFFFGIFFYYPEKRSKGSSLTTIYRVLKTAIRNRRLRYPSSKAGYYTYQGSKDESEESPTALLSSLISTISTVFKAAAIGRRRILPNPALKENDLEDPFYEGENGEYHVLPREASFYFLLFLDKAAIIREKKSDVEGNSKERYDVCTAEQVSDVKSLYPLIPLTFIFFAFSLTLASGDTYFVLQAQNMDPYVGNFNVPIMVFFVLQSLIAFLVVTIQPIRKLVKPTWSLAVAMFCSVLCCLAAFLVEHHRLHLIGPYKEYTELIIPLSIMVLTPQYFLLGLMRGFAQNGLEGFLPMVVPVSMNKFVEPGIQMLFAVGNLSSIVFLLIFRSWIKDSINDSHLDWYFLMLASLSFVFFGFYVCCVLKFNIIKLPQVDEPFSTKNSWNNWERLRFPLKVFVDNITS